MPDTYLAMTDYEFMKLHRSSYHHDPAIAARLDQQALVEAGRRLPYPPMTTSAPTSATSKIASERDRRGLTFPDSWEEAGLREPGEDF